MSLGPCLYLSPMRARLFLDAFAANPRAKRDSRADTRANHALGRQTHV